PTEPTASTGTRAPDLLNTRPDPRATSSATVLDSADLNTAAPSIDVSRPEQLLALGLRQPAIWELNALSAGQNSSTLATLGAWEQQRGLYNTALLLAYTAGFSPTSSSPAIRKLFYPLPH